MSKIIVGILVLLIWGMPCILTGFFIRDAISLKSLSDVGFVFAIIPVAIILFVTIAGLFSIPAQKAIIRGKFSREAKDKFFFWHKIYTICWSQVFFCKPVYFVCLKVPVLRKLLFKIFGYRGDSTNFLIDHHTWIRDLPVISIGKNVEISSGVTLGTNVSLSAGHFLVDQIKIGKKSFIGSEAVIAPGNLLADEVKIAKECTLGIRCWIDQKSSIEQGSVLSHGVIVGAEADIGTSSYVGLKAKIGTSVKIPSGSNIPSGTIVSSSEEALELYALQSVQLKNFVASLSYTSEQVYNEMGLS